MKLVAVYAQALDNMSPGYIELNGMRIEGEDIVQRQKATVLISEVAKNGQVMFDAKDVRLIVNPILKRWLLDIPVTELDCRGRKAPVAACGKFLESVSSAEIFGIVDEVEKVVQRGGRTLAEGSKERIKEAFEKMVQNYCNKSLKRHAEWKIGDLVTIVSIVTGIILILRRIIRSIGHRR